MNFNRFMDLIAVVQNYPPGGSESESAIDELCEDMANLHALILALPKTLTIDDMRKAYEEAWTA